MVKSFIFSPPPANESTHIKYINTTQLTIVICSVQKVLSVCIAFGDRAGNGHIRKLFVCGVNRTAGGDPASWY